MLRIGDFVKVKTSKGYTRIGIVDSFRFSNCKFKDASEDYIFTVVFYTGEREEFSLYKLKNLSVSNLLKLSEEGLYAKENGVHNYI